MKTIRIIPRLDIKGPNLVKGIHLEGLRVLGKPENFAKYYYENGADELFFQDTVASLYDRNSLHEIITRTAKEIFIPLTVGGGLRSLDDIKYVLRAGADKVAINTAAINNPKFIREASHNFGSSTIAIAIEAVKASDGRYFAYTHNGREFTGLEVVSWARQVEDLGAGEIIITSVDREGTGTGFDLDLILKLSEVLTIPLVAHGGASNETDIKDAIELGHADAVCIASILHYNYILNSNFGTEKYEEGNIDFLKSRKSYSKITPTTIRSIKEFLNDKGINIRLL